LTKLKKVDIKRLKNAVSVKYQSECISAAKNLLLKDSSSLTLSKPLGRYPDRQGLNKAVNELNDIFDIVQHVDECQALNALPRYVSDNSDSFPSMPLDEGELAFLFAKLDKMEAIIESLKSAVYAIQAKPLYVASTVSLGPNVASSSAGQTGRLLQSQPLIQPSRLKISAENTSTDNLGKTIANNTNSMSMATSTPSQRGHASNSWADLVAAERHPTDYSSSAGSNYADNDDAGFQRVKSPKHKRKRVDISQRQLDQQSSAAAAARGSNQLIGARPTRNSRPSLTTEPSGQKKNSRQPLLFGRKAVSTASNSTPTVAAAHAIKAVFLVDNLDNSCDTVSLTNFVTHMRVRVLSCFEVKPRTTRWQRAHGIIPDHRAFRVCVNRADTERFLDESKWPSDVTVSKWYSMKAAGNDHPPADTDETEAFYRQSTSVEPSTSKATASTSGSVAAAAARSDEEPSEEQPEGDRTVIEIDLADVSMSSTDPHSSTLNHNDGDS